ncbi:MAG: hypothetical protein ETSY1_11275 [Candidatus Entotheonella factor]|uniref:DUF4258 domain-containing protein n=1 Tax=Entotheonella factor TaxID=1429438 RepID=W4LRT0_ENTF1|nr:hypothetical protein [Candidatus Entotheonella palauensis]ETX00426.1 MAG: hypothetical protein ETSY1_11275 [Candidatus Entotheonella factor]
MTDFEFIWDEQPGGNVEHIEANNLSPEDVECAFELISGRDISRSSGRPMIYGYTPDDREIVVIYEMIADRTIYVVTAYEPD